MESISQIYKLKDNEFITKEALDLEKGTTEGLQEYHILDVMEEHGALRCTYKELYNFCIKDGVLCSSLQNKKLKRLNGTIAQKEIAQFILIEKEDAEKIKKYSEENLFYYEPLELYVLGVNHFGTSWDYVKANMKF